MKNSRYIFLYIFLMLCAPLFADEPRSALDNNPSVDISAKKAPQPPVTAPLDNEDAVLDELPAVKSEAQSTYVYDLKKLIIKSRENIKRVNDKIKEQAVVKRNQKREERAREYYQRGLQLQEEGKFDEAREYFEKAVRISEHPEMTKYIQASQIKLKAQESALKREQKEKIHEQIAAEQNQQQEVKQSYNEAVKLYREKKFKEAKDQFEHVEELIPDYKATRSYLKMIDQDIIQSEALLQKNQKQEMDAQQKEAEVARQREKEVWKKEIEVKEKERNSQVNQQAQEVYEEAVALYKGKKYAEAKKKFQEVEWVLPDYKASRNYLARADKDIKEEERRVAEENAKALAKQQWEEEVQKRKKEAQDKREAEEKERIQRKQLEEQAVLLYQAAVGFYDKKSYDEALEKFNDIEKTVSGFKSVRVYIAKINQIKEKEKKRLQDIEDKAKRQAELERQAKEETERKEKERQEKAERQKLIPAKVAVPEAVSPPVIAVAPPLNAKAEREEAEEILELARRSSDLFQKISSLTDDRRIVPAKKKMAQVEQMLGNLKNQKETIIREIRREEERQRQIKLQQEKELLVARVSQSYDEAILMIRNQQFDEAKARFEEIDNLIPKFKSTRQYLAHLDADKEKAERDAVLERTNAEEKRLKELEARQAAEELARKEEEQARRRKLREAQEMEIQSLAEKAAILNDDILNLSKEKNFQGAKLKFDELEKLLASLLSIKQSIAQEERKTQEEQAEAQRLIEEKAKKAEDAKKAIELAKKERIEQLQFKEKRRAAAEQAAVEAPKRIKREQVIAEVDANILRHKEMVRHRQQIYAQGVDLFEQKKYAAAKVIFDDLASQNYSAAKAYLRKIDLIMQKKEVKVRAAEEKERTNFITEQIRQQRLVNIMQGKERAHQKNLTKELERQKRLAEDERQRDRMRIESLRLQQKERQRIERERRQAERLQRQKEEEFQFRKITEKAVAKKKPVEKQKSKIKMKPLVIDAQLEPVQAEVTKPLVEVNSDVNTAAASTAVLPDESKKELTPRERQEQINISNKRKKFLEAQYRKEQAQKEKEERSRQKEERLKELKEKRERKVLDPQTEIQADIQEKQAKEKALREKREEILNKEKELKEQKVQKEKELKEKQERDLVLAKERKAKEEERRKDLERQKQEEEKRRLEDERRRQEIKKQQEEAAQAKAQKLQIEREARERQLKLENERKAIQQKLMDGVKDMYDEAMRLYKASNFVAAAAKFQDVEDLVPGYKKAGEFLSNARMRALKQSQVQAPVVQPYIMPEHTISVPDIKEPVVSTPISSDRSKAIQSTLDIYDPNAQ